MIKPTAHNDALAKATAKERARLTRQIDDCQLRIDYLQTELAMFQHSPADLADLKCDLRHATNLRRTARKLLANLAA